MQNPWVERQQSLTRLGFATYADYLKSDLWKAVRRKAFSKKERCMCYICGSTVRLEVHHLHYRVIDKPILGASYILCREHHERSHQIAKERHVSLKAGTGEACREWKRSGKPCAVLWIDRRWS